MYNTCSLLSLNSPHLFPPQDPPITLSVATVRSHSITSGSSSRRPPSDRSNSQRGAPVEVRHMHSLTGWLNWGTHTMACVRTYVHLRRYLFSFVTAHSKVWCTNCGQYVCVSVYVVILVYELEHTVGSNDVWPQGLFQTYVQRVCTILCIVERSLHVL